LKNILPAQFFSGRSDGAQMEPLRRLAFAVLVDAVHVFQNNFGAPRPDRRREFSEAQEWLLGPQGHGPFSFENVCYLVDLDPSWLRSSLWRWQAMKRAGQPCQAFARRSPVNRMGSLRSRPRQRVEHAGRNGDSRGGRNREKKES
jgi:hypothetical protein